MRTTRAIYVLGAMLGVMALSGGSAQEPSTQSAPIRQVAATNAAPTDAIPVAARAPRGSKDAASQPGLIPSSINLTNGVIARTSPLPSGLKDTDGDGMPDEFEDRYGFRKDDPSDAYLDADGDGLTNLEEYWAGTNPRDPKSVLRIERISMNHASNQIELTFRAVHGKSYSILRRNASDPEEGAWQKVTDVEPLSEDESVTVHDPREDGPVKKVYRIITPKVPTPTALVERRQ